MTSNLNPALRQQAIHLYQSHLRVAKSFHSYNFREFFLRQSKHKFRTEFPALVDRHQSTSQGSEILKKWLAEAEVDLAQLKRAAIVNRLYQVSSSY